MVGGYPMGNTIQECTRDIEGEIKRVTERIDKTKRFKDAIGEFLASGGHYEMDSQNATQLLFAMFGGMTLRIPELERNREKLIEELEESV